MGKDKQIMYFYQIFQQKNTQIICYTTYNLK